MNEKDQIYVYLWKAGLAFILKIHTILTNSLFAVLILYLQIHQQP